MQRKRKWILEWFGSRAGIQLLALTLAFGAWMVVNSGKTVEQLKTVNFMYVQKPKGLVFQSSPLKEGKVQLRGSLYRLRSLGDEELTYLIDLSNARGGANRVDLDLENLRLPLDVEARHMEPRYFYVQLEEIFVRSVPVRLVPKGNVKSGFTLIQMKARPESVSISGPRSVVSKLPSLDVEVPVDGRETSFVFPIKPELNLQDTEVIDSLEVDVDIAQQRFSRQYTNVRVSLSGATGDSRVSPEEASVTIEGSSQDAQGILGNLRVSVPASGLKRGRYRLRGRVDLPPGLKAVSIEPEYFIVEIGK